MTIKELKARVYEANMLLPKYGLITFTWGNVSEYDRESGRIAIKPSGVEYNELNVNDIVVLDIEGQKIEGKLNPSSDTDTHLELYRKFNDINGVVHTHSRWATIYAQQGKSIMPYGTTHGDYMYGAIPCTRDMTKEEIEGQYELETGKVIVETFKNLDPKSIPAVLVKNHGPFTWGINGHDAVHNAVVLEEVAMMAFHTELLSHNKVDRMSQTLLDKHYLRKHGVGAYYGQK